MGRPKAKKTIKIHAYVAGTVNDEVMISSYNDYVYKFGKSLKVVRRLRNGEKLVKLFVNSELKGYLIFDKHNRDLHIDGDIKSISTAF